MENNSVVVGGINEFSKMTGGISAKAAIAPRRITGVKRCLGNARKATREVNRLEAIYSAWVTWLVECESREKIGRVRVEAIRE